MATTELLNEQLLHTMKTLKIPQGLQYTILNLSPSQKQSMLDLYSRQTLLSKKRITESNNPLDRELVNRMNELSVPKHIQSQILTLPHEKKQILFEKYNKNTNRLEDNSHKRNNTIINESHTSLISDLESELATESIYNNNDNSYELDIQLLYLMKENNMRLTSLDKLKSFPTWKKQQYINKLKLKKKLKYIRHESKKNDDKQIAVFDVMDELTKYGSFKRGATNQSLIVNNASISAYDNGINNENEQKCLRCLRDINVHNINSKCKFHALLDDINDINDYNNIKYFVQRNNELFNAKKFKFACCNRKCKGYFINIKSQQNGCCVSDTHLFYREEEQEQVGDIFECNEIKNEQYTPSDEQEEGINKSNRCKRSDKSSSDKSNGSKSNLSLCGKWKVFVYIENKKSLHMVRDIEIFKHNKLGIIEGQLIGSTYIDNNKYKHNFDNDLYNGQIRDNQLILTYKSKHEYFESFVLNIDDYKLYGKFTSTHAKGTCQWFKLQKIK